MFLPLLDKGNSYPKNPVSCPYCSLKVSRRGHVCPKLRRNRIRRDERCVIQLWRCGIVRVADSDNTRGLGAYMDNLSTGTYPHGIHFNPKRSVCYNLRPRKQQVDCRGSAPPRCICLPRHEIRPQSTPILHIMSANDGHRHLFQLVPVHRTKQALTTFTAPPGLTAYTNATFCTCACARSCSGCTRISLRLSTTVRKTKTKTTRVNLKALLLIHSNRHCMYLYLGIMFRHEFKTLSTKMRQAQAPLLIHPPQPMPTKMVRLHWSRCMKRMNTRRTRNRIPWWIKKRTILRWKM